MKIEINSYQEYIKMRQDKAQKYFQLAKYQANLFSKDPSTKVGALFLAPQSLQVLTAGYNGFPRGVDETNAERWNRPQKLMYVSHAEANGVANACRHGTPLENSIAVVTMFPCATCAKLMIQAGISRIVTHAPDMSCSKWGEEFRYSLEMLLEAGVVIQYVSHEEALEKS